MGHREELLRLEIYFILIFMVSLLKFKVTLLNKTSFPERKVYIGSCPEFLTIDKFHLLGTKYRKKSQPLYLDIEHVVREPNGMLPGLR